MGVGWTWEKEGHRRIGLNEPLVVYSRRRAVVSAVCVGGGKRYGTQKDVFGNVEEEEV